MSSEQGEGSARGRSAVTSLTAGERLADILFRLVSSSDSSGSKVDHEARFRRGVAEAPEFLRRFGRPLDFAGRSVLDYGCGYGGLSFHLAEVEGAASVVGIDIDEESLTIARRKLQEEFSHLADNVDFRLASEYGDGKYDVVISKNCFQHYSNPEATLRDMIARLAPRGRILIGFGPLWKSPYGAPIGFMTKLPWAHLLLPESVIMRQREKFRPAEKARSYAEIRGGFNKMTLGRFKSIVLESGLRVLSFETNASPGFKGQAFRTLASVPGCREYFTLNAYSVLAPPG